MYVLLLLQTSKKYITHSLTARKLYFSQDALTNRYILLLIGIWNMILDIAGADARDN